MNDKTETYVPQKGSDGTEVYCPFTVDNAESNSTVDTRNDCVEKDVVERYSGNIDIRSPEQAGE